MAGFTFRPFPATVGGMFQQITLPLWAFVLILLFAVVTFASHFLFPSVRWFFRRRAERVVARLNTRLQKPIEPFKLARRYDMIQRLTYDSEVLLAVTEHAKAEGIPEAVAFEQARRYAREIVPSFSATLYFSVGARLAKWLARFLYRVRVGQFDRHSYDQIDPQDTVVFVMNHRSNMDYVLVTYLVSRTSALSYAVGEWARVWPLSGLIRMMGAYFIRRKSRGLLYRKVLARYVQMATEGGVTQAVFPEGGLSLTGGLAPARLGILNYIASDFDPEGERDVVFVPVAINYDRVLEDEILITAAEAGERRFRPSIIMIFLRVLRYLGRRLIGRTKTFGTATVSFGAPLSMREWGGADVETLGADLMARIAEVVPPVPVALAARAVLSGAKSDEDVRAAIASDFDVISMRRVPGPKRSADRFASAGLDLMRQRGLIAQGPSALPTAKGARILPFYAQSVAHHFADGPEPSVQSQNLAAAPQT